MVNKTTNWVDGQAPSICSENLNNLEANALKGADFSDSATALGKSLLSATDANTARNAIGAGTSNLAIGTTATTAKVGNYTPAWGDVTGKPTTFAPVIGTTATTAMAGNTALLQIGTTATTAKAGNYTPPNVTTSANGLMLATDKVKLDGFTGKTVTPVVAPVIDVTEPADAEQLQGEMQKIIDAIKSTGLFT